MIRQAQIGRDHVFVYRPRHLPAAAPTLTVASSAGALASVALTQVRAAANVTAVAADGSSVTTNATGAAERGLIGDNGGTAWLDLGAHGQFPVRVLRVTAAGVAVLGADLPRGIPTTATGTLDWNVWHTTILAATLGASVDRTAYWSVDYTADLGADHPGETEHDDGPMRIVRRPFATGLDHHRLVTLIPSLPGRVPQGCESYQPVIDTVDMLTVVEEQLGRDEFADQLLGAQWVRAHALLVAAHLAEVGWAQGLDPESFRVEAYKEIARIKRRIQWLDADDDGVVDAEESPLPPASVVGLTASHAATLLAEYDAGTRTRPELGSEVDR